VIFQIYMNERTFFEFRMLKQALIVFHIFRSIMLHLPVDLNGESKESMNTSYLSEIFLKKSPL